MISNGPINNSGILAGTATQHAQMAKAVEVKMAEMKPKLRLVMDRDYDGGCIFFKWHYRIIANIENSHMLHYVVGIRENTLGANFAYHKIWFFPELFLNYRVNRIKKKIKKQYDQYMKINKSLNFHSKLEQELYG